MSRRRRRGSSDIVGRPLKCIEKRTDDVFGAGWDEVACCIQPLSNVTVGSEELTITVDLPLADEGEVAVKVCGKRSVEVYARTKHTVRFDDLGIKHRTGEFTCYRAMLDLPEAVDATKLTYEMKRGILEIRLPRSRQEPPR